MSKQTRHGSESAYSASHYLDMDYTDSSSTADLRYLEKYYFFSGNSFIFVGETQRKHFFHDLTIKNRRQTCLWINLDNK